MQNHRLTRALSILAALMLGLGLLSPANGATASSAAAASAAAGLFVRSSDDNSGVTTIQASLNPDFSQASSYPCTGSLTPLPFMAPTGATFYLRAIDRSGNISASVSGVGPDYFNLFLPGIRR